MEHLNFKIQTVNLTENSDKKALNFHLTHSSVSYKLILIVESTKYFLDKLCMGYKSSDGVSKINDERNCLEG